LAEICIKEVAHRVNGKNISFSDGNIEAFVGGITFKYQPAYGQILLQAPLVNYIPNAISPFRLHNINEKILSYMDSGGIGYSKSTNNTFQIVMHTPLKLKSVTNELGLLEFVPKFKESVEDWIPIMQNILIVKGM